MKKKEIRDLATEELRHKASELREEIVRLKMKRQASAVENKMLIRNTRRSLARILTMLQQKAG